MLGLGENISIMRDQLSLQSAELYLKDLQTIMFFVSNVPIKGSARDYNDIGFNKTKIMFQKAAQQYGIKIIVPLRKFLLRVLDENLGFVELHTFFLALCNNYYVPRQALSILQRPALFRNIYRSKVAQFLIEGCDIYIKLGQYVKAYQLLERGKSLEFMDFESTLKLNSRIIVLQINMGYEIKSQARERLKMQAMKLDFSASPNLNQQIKQQLSFQIQFYAGLRKYEELTPHEKHILEKDGLLEVYENAKWTSLRKYINEDIKKNNWRIKAQSIKEQPLANMEVITGINKNQEVYRYDCKHKTMYFNHKQSDQEKLNSLISLAMNMSEEVSTCKINRKERDMVGGRGMKMDAFGFGGMGRNMQMQFMRRLG